jgi:sigma-B regulation protein RsbU (phosphoserine phosphatase)
MHTLGFIGGGLAAWLAAAAAAAVVVCLLHIRRLRRRRDRLLQEKDVVYRFVHDVSEAFVDADTAPADFLLARVLYYAQQTSRAGAGAIYLLEPDGSHLRVRALAGVFPPLAGGFRIEDWAAAESPTQYLDQAVRRQIAIWGQGLIGEVAERGLPLLIQDAERDSRVPRFDSDFLEIRSLALVPMRFQNAVLGVVVVVNRVDDRPFEQADLDLLQALADQASLTLHVARFNEEMHKKKLLDYDLKLARRIQNALLPRIPDFPGVGLAAFSLPAREIGGDYYDFFRMDDELIGLAVADVSGKGITGAILMSICRSVFRASVRSSRGPAATLREINRVIAPDIYEDMFISVLYAVLNTRTFELTLARAGHPRPILLAADGGLRELESGGMAMGMGDPDVFDACLEETRVTLQPGDTIAVYTDGVTEAMNDRREDWGVPRFQDVLRAGAGQGARAAVEAVQRNLVQFIGYEPQYDDMTLVVLQRTQGGT